MRVNWDDGIDNPVESDNRHSQVEHVNEGDDGDCRDNCGDKTCDVRYTWGRLMPQVI